MDRSSGGDLPFKNKHVVWLGFPVTVTVATFLPEKDPKGISCNKICFSGLFSKFLKFFNFRAMQMSKKKMGTGGTGSLQL